MPMTPAYFALMPYAPLDFIFAAAPPPFIEPPLFRHARCRHYIITRYTKMDAAD